MKLVLVEWVDSKFSAPGWACHEHMGELNVTLAVTVGFIIKETEDKIVVCQNTSENDRALGIAIPRLAIKRIRGLKIK